MLNNREIAIIDFLKFNPGASSKEIHDGVTLSISYATAKRLLSKLTNENLVSIKGQGKGTKYFVSSVYELLQPVDIDQYYEEEIDERKIKIDFNFGLISFVLVKHSVFTTKELEKLNDLQKIYTRNILHLTDTEYKKELERLAIDLSWKSSQIEGNTYSLLETERLLKDKETASGKTKEEAVMLLNHKDAIDFIIDNPNYLIPVSPDGMSCLRDCFGRSSLAMTATNSGIASLPLTMT